MNLKDKGLFVLLFVTVFFFVSCASYETRPITSDIMYDISSKTVSDENVTVEKSFWSMPKDMLPLWRDCWIRMKNMIFFLEMQERHGS